MKINSIKVYYIAYNLYVISKVISRTPSGITGRYLQNVITALVLALLMLSMAMNVRSIKINRNQIITLLIIIIITGISIISRDLLLLSIILFGINATNLQDEEILNLFKYSFYSVGITTIIVVFLCRIGLIENVSTARSWGGEARYAWGFVHSQIIPLTVFYLIGDRITYHKKVRIQDLVMMVAIVFLLDRRFDSRNALYSSSLLVILCLLWRFEVITRFSHKKSLISEKIYTRISRYVAIWFSFLSIGLLYLYKRGFRIAILIDRLLSSRLRAATVRFSSVPMQFLRIVTYAEYQETSVSVIDNGYLYIIARYGWLYLIFFVIIAYYIACYFRKINNIPGTLFLISALISCYITNEIVSCNFLPFWIIGFRELLVNLNNRRPSSNI